VHALNSGIPVPVGMAWPHYRSLRTGYLSAQQPVPDSGHAVTIVGYRCPSGHLEDTVFLFKNSWGPQWGQGGYGTVTFGYLNKNLGEAVLLEVQPSSAPPHS
jgi:C1A family cysteine protease